MFKIHLLLAIRHFWKHKTISLINLLGLSLGICAFVLILQYVAFEWSFNSAFDKADQIFRVVETSEEDGFFLPPGYAPAVAGHFPGVDAYTRILPNVGNGVIHPENSEGYFRVDQTAFVDSSFLSFFDRPLLEGVKGFTGPNQLLLAASKAQTFFGNTSAIGKTLQLDNQFGSIPYSVVGVYEDFPSNSDYFYDILFSIQTLASPENRNGNDWADPNGTDAGFGFIFVELQDAQQAPQIAESITQWVRENAEDEKLNIGLQALSGIHLGKNLRDPFPQYGNRTLVVFLLFIALLILGIAFVNYVNLSTAQGMERAKEVGIRKVSGAKRAQLAYQYLLETFLLTFFAAFIAFALIPVIQPAFNSLVGQPLSLGVLTNSGYLGLGAIVLTLGTFLAGYYVAVVLTGLAPIQSLKGTFKASAKGNWLQKTLVVAQFAISIALIAGTLILFLQLRYVNKRDLGVNIQQRIAITGPSVKTEDFGQKQQVFRDKLTQLPFVKSFCSSGGVPGKYYNFGASNITQPNHSPEDEEISYSMLFIDERYIETFELPQISGRNFTSEEALKGFDAGRFMLNETAARLLHFEQPEQAVGQTINWGESNWEVVGVLKDYNHSSLHIPVEPIVFIPSRNSGYFTINMNMEDFPFKKAQLSQLYAESFPGNPFEYEFLDETYAQLYDTEQRLGKLFTLASLLAIFISALGLLGLASFVARQKTKEIGIRKVLGASVSSIIQLLSQDFLKLVLFSFFIAAPLAWYVMDSWLKNFAYRIDIPWWVFTLAGLATAGLAFLTVSLQSMRVALANPVESLRTE